MVMEGRFQSDDEDDGDEDACCSILPCALCPLNQSPKLVCAGEFLSHHFELQAETELISDKKNMTATEDFGNYEFHWN